MEAPHGSEKDKRRWEQEVEEEENVPQAKKPRVPALASVIVEALKLDSLQRLCSSLEPLLRRIVSEEVERALTKLGNAKPGGRCPLPKIEGTEARKLQLHFRSRLPPHLFTGAKVEGEQGEAIHVVLVDANTGLIVRSGPESGAKLNVVVLEGDFNDENGEDWSKEHFEINEVKEREGKRPLLTGDLQVTLVEGVGTLGDLMFTDNSSWIRSRKFRLGLKLADNFCDGIRVREAKTDAFAVKDHRGELYKKHYPPALHDEVWRLDRIAKDGALHKKLITAEILTVEDFLRLLVRDSQRLRHVLGSGMSNRMWENTVEHAKTCVLGGKLYVYYADESWSTGAVFNHIYELRGLTTNGQFIPAESLTHNQKVSVNSLVKRAYEDWMHIIEYDGKALLKSLEGKNAEAPFQSQLVPIQPGVKFVMPPISQHNFISNPLRDFQAESSSFSGHGNQPIESPSTRPDPMVGLELATPQIESGAIDFQSLSTSTPAVDYLSGDWSRSCNGRGLDDFFVEEELCRRSSGMLESDNMERILQTFTVGGFSHSDEACYSYSNGYEPLDKQRYVQQRGRSSGKAVVGWLKLRAALRWGIFVRKRAAQRRAQLIELD